MKLCTYLFTSLICYSLLSQKVDASISHFKLDNGLQLVVYENHRAPVVHNMLWYKAGNTDSPLYQSGLAHLLEHMMFRSTNEYNIDYSSFVSNTGGSDNAFTSNDFTAYFATIYPDFLDDILKLEAARMSTLDFSTEHFLTEQKVVVEERRQRTDSNPLSLFREQLLPSVFLQHPYSRSVIGLEKEILSISPDDLKLFHKQFYAPNNTVLVVVGDVNAESVYDIVRKYFSHIKPRNIPVHNFPTLAHNSNHLVSFSTDRVTTPVWQRDVIVESLGSQNNLLLPSSYDILAILLGDGPNSSLHKLLITKHKLALNFSVNYWPYKKGPATFSINVKLKKNVSPQLVTKLVETHLNNLLSNPFTLNQIQYAATRIQDAFLLHQDSLHNVAYNIGMSLSIGLDYSQFQKLQSIYENPMQFITPLDISNSLHKIVNSHSVTSIISPQE